jgi:hypothetical protein
MLEVVYGGAGALHLKAPVVHPLLVLRMIMVLQQPCITDVWHTRKAWMVRSGHRSGSCIE